MSNNLEFCIFFPQSALNNAIIIYLIKTTVKQVKKQQNSPPCILNQLLINSYQFKMGKKESEPNQSNKSHKTLRDKLRKKRQDLKKHKKQKSDKHKQYDEEQQKKKFFDQINMKKQKREDGIKEHRLCKHIEKFVDIYEDDVEDFYDLFDTLDQGGSIDITDVADPQMQKCLKKMFKYLPLSKKNLEYTKKQGVTTKLKMLIKQLVSKSIENYLENGTDQEENQSGASDKQSSQQNRQKEKKDKKKKKKEKKQKDTDEQKELKKQIEHKNLRQYQKLQLYSEKFAPPSANSGSIGPFISTEQRQFLAKIAEQQRIKQTQGSNLENQGLNEENSQFDRIFAMASSSKTKQKESKPNIDDIPEELLAEGSARIGQKQQIDSQEIEEYNKAYRPRKLVEEYQQMRKIGKYADVGADGKKKRVPFDRERDVVNGRSRQFMNNGVFFDFKERMTKPKGTNNFL